MIIIRVEITWDNIEMDFREMGSKLHSVGSVRLNWWAFWKCRKQSLKQRIFW